MLPTLTSQQHKQQHCHWYFWSVLTLWWAVREEFQSAGTEEMHREAVHSKWLPPLSLCVQFRKDFALKWPVSFDLL